MKDSLELVPKPRRLEGGLERGRKVIVEWEYQSGEVFEASCSKRLGQRKKKKKRDLSLNVSVFTQGVTKVGVTKVGVSDEDRNCLGGV